MKKFLLFTTVVIASTLFESAVVAQNTSNANICVEAPITTPKLAIKDVNDLIFSVEILNNSNFTDESIEFGFKGKTSLGAYVDIQIESSQVVNENQRIVYGRVPIDQVPLPGFTYELILKTSNANTIFRMTDDSGECYSEFTVAEDHEYYPTCTNAEDYINYYACEWNGSHWQVINDSCTGDAIPNDLCSDLNTNPDAFEIEDYLYSEESFCARCVGNSTSGLPKVGYGERCQDIIQCDSGLLCRQLGQGEKHCLKKENSVDISDSDNTCIVGGDECVTFSSEVGAVVCSNDTAGSFTEGRIGTKGICGEPPEITLIDCVAGGDKDCEELGSDKGLERGVHYQYARCSAQDTGDGKCEFTWKDIDEVDSPNNDDNEPTSQTPVDPAVLISNTAITSCEDDLTCINCHVRLCENPPDCTQTRTFQNIGELFTGEEADRPETPQNDMIQPLVYTNYVYSALGCIDTSESGVITRFLQISLGIIGGIIAIKIGQIVMLMQAGDPEKFKDAWDHLWRLFLALMLLLYAVIGSQFLGINLLRVLPPGTIVTDT